MGRKTYEALIANGGDGSLTGLEVVVFSRSLPPKTLERVRITSEDAGVVVKALKSRPGRDIWLFGGGALFRSLLDARLVDTVEVAVIPVLLGHGIPLLPPGASTRLELVDQKTLPASGIVALSYRVRGRRAPGARIRYVKARKSTTRGRATTRGTFKKSTSPRKQTGKKR
jgi:dihydrofolate reductase